MNWISIHIFFTNDVDKFLVDCLVPLVTKNKENGSITGFFFIRYNEGGPHIRFRFKTDKEECGINIAAEISAFLSLNPSPVDLTRDPAFFANDSVHFIPYLPELDRYGGLIAMDFAEEQFQNSSEVILKFLADESGTAVTYYNKMTAIIILNVISVFAYCDGNLEKAIMFFAYLFNNLRGNYSAPFLKKDFSIELNYRNYYLNQRDVLATFIRNVWEGIQNNEQFEIGFDNLEWLIREKKFISNIQELHSSGNIQTLDLYENYPLWSIFQSNIHMTNNRIGIPPHEEALIAYYIMRALQEITD